MGANAGALAVGVSNIEVPIGSTNAQYYWCQTWGVASVLAGSNTTLGDAVMRGTAGAGETLVGVAGDQAVGVSYQLGVDTNYCQIFLQIAP